MPKFMNEAATSPNGATEVSPLIGMRSGFDAFMSRSICSNSSRVLGCSDQPAFSIEGVWTHVRVSEELQW